MSDFLGLAGAPNSDAATAPAATTWWNWNPARRTAVVETPTGPEIQPRRWSLGSARRPPTVVQTAAPVAPVVEGPSVERIRQDAYAEGRRDERRRRRTSPIASLMLILAAIAGAAFVILAMLHGSFAGGGAVVDQELTRLPAQTAGVVHNVRAEAASPAAQPAAATSSN